MKLFNRPYLYRGVEWSKQVRTGIDMQQRRVDSKVFEKKLKSPLHGSELFFDILLKIQKTDIGFLRGISNFTTAVNYCRIETVSSYG